MFFPKTYSTIVAQPQDMHNKESFRNLKVWQRSMILVEEIYRVTRCFPRTEQFVEVQLEIANRVGFLAQAEYERNSRNCGGSRADAQRADSINAAGRIVTGRFQS
jgi:hypothetical protein